MVDNERQLCAKDKPIGVFDSGVGGVSVLRQARVMLPLERFIYYGDTYNAPYGEKTAEQVNGFAGRVADQLVALGVKALVIACNTATAAAAETLRARLSIPVIGMEPALKPASMLRQNGLVLVLATPMTLAMPKFARLMSRYGDGAVRVPCPGLMEFVERGEMDGEALTAYLYERFRLFQNEKIDAVVLGCTHYVFLRAAIASVLPGVPIIDGNEGTVRQLKRRLEAVDALRTDGAGSVTFLSSGGENAIQKMRMLLELPL